VSLGEIDTDIDAVSAARSGYGAVQNRLEHALAVTGSYQENLTSAESRIRDVDMAEEMVTLTKNQILQQAGTAMLAQANQAPQAVLQLLR
jgi:flagellin